MTRAFRVESEAKGGRRAREGAELPSQSSAEGNTRSSVRASSGGTVWPPRGRCGREDSGSANQSSSSASLRWSLFVIRHKVAFRGLAT